MYDASQIHGMNVQDGMNCPGPRSGAGPIAGARDKIKVQVLVQVKIEVHMHMQIQVQVWVHGGCKMRDSL
eukprot:4487826-Karenia_brevis.AAC.1